MIQAIQAIVVGATGYVGGELLRLIAGHPQVDLHAAVSTTRAGAAIANQYPALQYAYADRAFVTPEAALARLDKGARLAIFSAAPHGKSAGIVAALLDDADVRSADVRVVDVSADFRYPDAAGFESVYGIAHGAPALIERFSSGLPEQVASPAGVHVGHPGCFATALLLATVPLVDAGLLDGDLFATGVTGSTGSGRSPSPGTHHPERHGNLYAYKPLAHRHVPEVEALTAAATGQAIKLNFVPHSGPFARGIYVTVQGRMRHEQPRSDLVEALSVYYADSRFVSVVEGAPRLKDVLVSNHCHLGVATDGDVVAVSAAIDNLVKGAAGGALQWMNRLFELPEETGLEAPAPAWT